MPMRSKLIILNPISYYFVLNGHCGSSVEDGQVDKAFGIHRHSAVANLTTGVLNESKVRIIRDIRDMITR